ncbi:MAG: glutamate ligase domain-containing protein [Collinsella sp.]
MEVVESKDGRVICVVDYAHNQLSFRSLSSSVARVPASPVIAVFAPPAAGTGAPRAASARGSTIFRPEIFANEDPAHEDPMKVCRELAEHVPDDTPNKIILDREAAVHAAFKAAREEYVNPDAPTIVLLLAKGDEELMHVGDEFVPIESDLSLANRLIDVTQFD